jgi:hypothetical protein
LRKEDIEFHARGCEFQIVRLKGTSQWHFLELDDYGKPRSAELPLLAEEYQVEASLCL